MIYRLIKKLYYNTIKPINYILTIIIFKGYGVKYDSFKTTGTPYIMCSRNSKGIYIGPKFSMHNILNGNPIGINNKCIFVVYENAKISIGSNVGISQSTLVAHANIIIGNNVKIGGGTCIYTSDFHSLNADIRRTDNDKENKMVSPVQIGDDVFIGAKCMILKGVKIGNRSIIGAGSVVTKNIPDDEIWAGNPARFIRKANNN